MNIKKISVAFLSLVALAIPTLCFSVQPAKAGLDSKPDCPDSGNASTMTSDCYGTPTVMEIPFYELGFCTSDPLDGYSFSRANCSKAWSSTTPETIDLADFNYTGLSEELTYQIPNQTYSHAYVIVGNTWGLKGEAYFNSKTYYTDSSGDVTENLDNYSKFDNKITDMEGTESTGSCFDYAETTDYGPIKAVLTDSNLVTATGNSSCNSSVRMIGSIDLDTDLVMTDSIKTYNLTWIIRNMGLYVNWNFGTSPVGWWAGPFVPNFVLSE
mgnify:CR=1 FL=1